MSLLKSLRRESAALTRKVSPSAAIKAVSPTLTPTTSLPASGLESLQHAPPSVSTNAAVTTPVKEYVYPTTINWYPGHMVKAQRQLREQFFPRAHMILEIRDSRVPLSSVNPQIEELIKNKQKLIVFNKSDLLTPSAKKRLLNYINTEYNGISPQTSSKTSSRPTSNALLTDPTRVRSREKPGKHRNVTAVLGDSREHFLGRRVASELKKMAVAHRQWQSLPVVIAIVGYPNVGKSTLINSLRNLHKMRGTAKVGKEAGITRHISAFKISNNPLIHILDTPGIFVPALKLGSSGDSEIGMKLSLCGMLKDSAAGILEIADYCLYRLNKHGNEKCVANYLKMCGMIDSEMDAMDGTDGTDVTNQRIDICNDIELLMYSLARKEGFMFQHYDRVSETSYASDEPDIHQAAHLFVTWYRQGLLDKTILDELPF